MNLHNNGSFCTITTTTTTSDARRHSSHSLHHTHTAPQQVIVVVVIVVVLVLAEYWSNSQYCIQLHLPEKSVFCRRSPSDDDGKCSMIVSLMQKKSRRSRTLYNLQRADVAMNFHLYKVLQIAYLAMAVCSLAFVYCLAPQDNCATLYEL